jgi:hypothetical protein
MTTQIMAVVSNLALKTLKRRIHLEISISNSKSIEIIILNKKMDKDSNKNKESIITIKIRMVENIILIKEILRKTLKNSSKKLKKNLRKTMKSIIEILKIQDGLGIIRNRMLTIINNKNRDIKIINHNLINNNNSKMISSLKLHLNNGLNNNKKHL